MKDLPLKYFILVWFEKAVAADHGQIFTHLLKLELTGQDLVHIDQLCQTQMAYWAKNQVTILTQSRTFDDILMRAAH